MMFDDKPQSKQSVRERALEISRTMRQLAQRSRALEADLIQLERGGLQESHPRFGGTVTTSSEERECNNERSYLRADLEMSREMHARLEGVFERLLAVLDAKEADTYLRMHEASGKI